MPIFTFLEKTPNWMCPFAPCFFAKRCFCENNLWIIHVECTVDPWTAWIWTALVHWKGDFFHLTRAVQLTCSVQTRVVQRSAPSLGILIVDLTVITHRFSTAWKVVAPNPRLIQGSTVFLVHSHFYCCVYIVFNFLFKIFYLFIFREEKGGRKRRREKSMCGLPFACPLLGAWPATQACALTGNWTCAWLFGWQASSQSTEPHQPGIL